MSSRAHTTKRSEGRHFVARFGAASGRRGPQAPGRKRAFADRGNSLNALRDPLARVRYSGARAYEINWRRR
jgi:hypothetical protein